MITESILFGKFKSNLDKIKSPELILTRVLFFMMLFLNLDKIKKQERLKIKRLGIDFLVTKIYVKN